MTFPGSPLPAVVEIQLDGEWTDITEYVYERGDTTITRGRSAEGSVVSASTCRLQINNRDGRFSPRNPTGPYYGLIGRNTPLRVRVEDHADPAETFVYLHTKGAATSTDAGDELTTPDSTALSITGDIDIRVDVDLLDWGLDTNLTGKYVTTGNQRSFAFYIFEGQLVLRWSADGSTSITKGSTATLPFTSDRHALRVTLDVNNGAAGNTVTFYTADTLAGSWTQLGSAVVTAGTTSIFNSTAELEAGNIKAIGQPNVHGRLYGFELRNGIGGSVVADLPLPDGPSTDAFTDNHSNTWSPQRLAQIITLDNAVRFTGEVSEWPQRWDLSGNDVWVPIEASGPMRRLDQGDVIASTMYRAATTSLPNLVAYWPSEDEEGAHFFGSAVGWFDMVYSGTPDIASYSGFDASKPLPVTDGTGRWRGPVAPYTATGNAQVRWLMHVPEAGTITDGTAIMRIITSGTAEAWEIYYETDSGGTFRVRAFDEDGVEIENSGALVWSDGVGLDGRDVFCSFEIEDDGADLTWRIQRIVVGARTGQFLAEPIVGKQIGTVREVIVSPNSSLPDVAIGHITVEKQVDALFALYDQVKGYTGEEARYRIARLCYEYGIGFHTAGTWEQTSKVGPQRPGKLIDLLREAAAVDAGILYEPRDFYGLAYRPREALCNQPAVLTLDHSIGQVNELEPTEDDQAIRNDVTVSREGGSSARAVEENGPLSVAAPPTGVGRYADSVTINPSSDGSLKDHAGWRLHISTVDEARYPVIGVNLARPDVAVDDTLAGGAVALDIGDRLVVNDLPEWMPPEAVSQVAQGFTERLKNFARTISVNCSPESPYQVGVWEGDEDRFDSDGSELYTAIDSDDTQVEVITTEGASWTTAAADFPFDITVGGERMTVTGISGGPMNANPTFEADANNWSSAANATIAQSDDFAHTGSWSLKITPDGATANSGASSEQINISQGGNFTARGWFYSPGGYTGCGIQINWYDASDAFLSASNSITAISAGVWTRRTVTAAPPANSVYARLRPIQSGTPAAGDIVYVDECELVSEYEQLGSGQPIGFVGAGAGDSQLNASVTPGLPSAIKAGDVALIFASIRNTSGTVNTPTNWTKLSGFGGSTHAAIYARVYDGVWTMPTITFTGGVFTDDTIAQACAFRGVDITLDAIAAQSNASAQNIATPALDVTGKGRLIVWAGWKQDDFSSAVHANSLATTINTRVGTSGNDAGQVWSYRIFDPAADVGASSFTVTGGASAISRGATLALKQLPQTLTVIRSVNGVAKSHSSEAAVSLAERSYWMM